MATRNLRRERRCLGGRCKQKRMEALAIMASKSERELFCTIYLYNVKKS